MIRRASRFTVAAALAYSLATPRFAFAAESYQQFCSAYQTLSQAQFAAAEQRDSDSRDRVPDAVVIGAVKVGLPDSANVSVAIRQYNLVAGDGEGKPEAVAEITQGAESRFVIVQFTKQDALISTRPIAGQDLQKWYTFARAMAAYMLLNDLLASDAVVPRLGCVRAAEIQLASVPGVLPEIDQAYMTTPQQEPGLMARAKDAYHRFVSSGQAQADRFTSETISRLGADPSIEIVYRDVVTDGDQTVEYDVARLSNGPIRTYIAMQTEHGVLTMSSPGLCVVGDTRCAGDYRWP